MIWNGPVPSLDDELSECRIKSYSFWYLDCKQSMTSCSDFSIISPRLISVGQSGWFITCSWKTDMGNSPFEGWFPFKLIIRELQILRTGKTIAGNLLQLPIWLWSPFLTPTSCGVMEFFKYGIMVQREYVGFTFSTLLWFRMLYGKIMKLQVIGIRAHRCLYTEAHTNTHCKLKWWTAISYLKC